ncbi:hypothetical protein M514_25788 [Trichuris suis]|uniref:Uncharacterized protein n=1 Tax=Trichuris suis TaxID=68888 RepID=A0A085MXX3_9BILA|nr:hypothetical protein M514_25788 [Trichuris suis]
MERRSMLNGELCGRDRFRTLLVPLSAKDSKEQAGRDCLSWSYVRETTVKWLMRATRVTYVPAEDIEKYALYKKSMSNHSSCSSLAKLSLKSFPDYYQTLTWLRLCLLNDVVGFEGDNS